MPEPVSTTVGVCLLSYAALNTLSRPGNAVSAEAETVTLRASALMQSIEQSQALFGEKAFVISRLRALANECAEPDWDGNGANPINLHALKNAEDFVRALPEGLPMPEPAPEPDGAISLDWIPSRHRLFSLSVGDDSRLAFAWLDGADRGHAVARFDGTSIPERVLAGICSILNVGHASLRAS